MKYSLFLPLLLLITIHSSYAEQEKYSVGAGAGALYGNSGGISFNYRAIDKLDLTASLGGYRRPIIGLQYHLSSNSHFWQPRISLNYGINGRLDTYEELDSAYSSTRNHTNTEYFYGLSAGIGTRLGFGHKRKNGLTLDIFYRISDGGLVDRERYLEEQNRLNDQEYGCVGPGPLFASLGGYYRLQFSVGWNYKF